MMSKEAKMTFEQYLAERDAFIGGWHGPRTEEELDLVIAAFYDGTYNSFFDENGRIFSDSHTKEALRYDLSAGIPKFGVKDGETSIFSDHFIYRGKGYSTFWPNGLRHICPDDLPGLRKFNEPVEAAIQNGTWHPRMMKGKLGMSTEGIHLDDPIKGA
jgi:hypothetical protein